MKKRILILAAALMLTSCAKGFTPLNETERDKNVELNENFDYSAVSDIGKYENKEYKHLSIDNGAIKDSSVSSLYEFEAKINTENLNHLNDIGKVLFDSEYDTNKWNIKKINYGTEEAPNERSIATYLNEKKILQCSATTLTFKSGKSSFMAKAFPPDVYRNDYPPSEQKKAKDLIDRLFYAMGKTPPEFYGAVYLEDMKAWEFDFRQNNEGLTITDIGFRRNNQPGNVESEEFSNISYYGKCSVSISESEDLSVFIDQYYFDDTDKTEKYDEAITVESALEFIDDNIANNSEYTVKNAELQYMLVMHDVKTDEGNTAKALKAVPAWVFEIMNNSEKQRYGCVINAVNGNYSFVKLNGEEEQ